jgi:hypothetical protein
LNIYRSGVYLVKVNNVLSFKIDNHAHVGNFYSFDHATETSIYLKQGAHKLYICTAYDVRVHGSSIPPHITFSGSFRSLDEIDPNFGMVPYIEDIILPEIVDGELMSEFGSVSIRNGVVGSLDEGDTSDIELDWKMVEKIYIVDTNGNEVFPVLKLDFDIPSIFKYSKYCTWASFSNRIQIWYCQISFP